MSQKTRASAPLGSTHGSTSKVSASGSASTSLSCTRLKPSIDEPSNVMPSWSAFSISAGLIAKLLRFPSTSVNQRRTRRMPRSSMVCSTYSRRSPRMSATPSVCRRARALGAGTTATDRRPRYFFLGAFAAPQTVSSSSRVTT